MPEVFIVKKPPVEKPRPVSAERFGHAPAVSDFLP